MEIRLVYIEDNPSDQELFDAAIASSSIQSPPIITDSLSGLEEAMIQGVDVVVSDFNLRSFDGLDVLRFVRSKEPDIPFIFLSSTIGEERVVSLVKDGATDFVLKDNLQNIPHKIERAHKEHLLSKERESFRVEVQEKTSMFETLLNSQTDLVYLLNEVGVIMHANEALSSFLNTPATNVLGKHESQFFKHPESASTNLSVIENGSPYSYYLDHLSSSGARTILQVVKSPLKIGDQIKGLVSVCRDITQSKVLQDSTSKANQILQQAEWQANLGSFELDLENDILSVSANLINLLELNSDKNFISVKKLISKVHPDDQPLFKERFKNLVEQSVDFEMENKYLLDHGEKYCRTVIKAYGINGHSALYGTIQDITEERKASMAVLNIQQQEREKISRELHDNLGQKLSACSMFMNMEDFDRVKIKGLVDDSLSDVRKISRVLSSSYLDGQTLADSVLHLIDNLPNKEIFEFTSSAGENILSDLVKGQVFRIIQEALNNALKYSEATKVKVGLSASNQIFTLLYDDNGKGFQVSSTTLGNGLRNMKERARYCNGQFSLQSKVGTGTKIVIKIPLK